MIYFNACIQDWWGSAGFGGRRFDGTLPLFVLGVAASPHASVEFIRRFPLRRLSPRRAAAAGALERHALMAAAQARHPPHR